MDRQEFRSIVYNFANVAWLVLAANWCRVATAEPIVLEAARVIRCETGKPSQPAVITGVALTPDGRSIAAATDDNGVTIWNAATGLLEHRFDAHLDWVRSVAISPDGGILVSGANDCTNCLWGLAQRQKLFQLPSGQSAVANVRVHANGQQVAVVGFHNTLQIVNVSTGQVTQQHDCAGDDQRAVAFSRDGVRMAAAGRNGRIRIWNVDQGAHERDVETDGRPIRTLDFSPDGRLLVAGGDGPQLHVIEAATGQSVKKLEARPAKVYAALFLDHRQLAAGGSDNQVRIWNIDCGQVTTLLVGHTGTVAALAARAEGRMLVSSSYDTTLRIWELGDGQPNVTTARPWTAPAR
jgi:WD40 repeat protein